MPRQIDQVLYEKTLTEMYRDKFERGYVPPPDDEGIERKAYFLWRQFGGVSKFVTAATAAATAEEYGAENVRQEAVTALYEVAQQVIQKAAARGEVWAPTSTVCALTGNRSEFHNRFGMWSLPEWNWMCAMLKADGFLILKDAIYWL